MIDKLWNSTGIPCKTNLYGKERFHFGNIIKIDNAENDNGDNGESSVVYWGYLDNFKPVYLFIFLTKSFCMHKNTSQAKIS